MTSLRRFAVLLFALTIASAVAFAGEEDPPSRAVRLDYLSGKVSVQPGGVNDWVAASINRPLTSSDRVWTDQDSRAELNLGTSAIRMDDQTSLTLNNVTDNTVQVELYQGTLNLRVAHLYDGEIYEVDTPNLTFTVLKSGSYRFDVDSNADTTLVTVWKGEGEANGDGPGVRIRGRQEMQFSHDKSLVHTALADPQTDGFDDWCRVRDNRMDRARSLQYVARGVIGYEDLDDYGNWVYVAPYGYIWRPVVVGGWAPYRYGHWIWVAPWGWTWVDDAPWGFAPFHYGRWVYTSGYWGWCPGPIVVRPYYAPALVAWVGGAHWGVGVSIGSVGWFPLGWGEPYWPYYRASRGYFRSVNISNTRITNITYITNNYYGNPDNYHHRWVNGGHVTVVPRDTIVNARPVDRDRVHLPPGQIREARWTHDPNLTPSRDSRLGPHRDIPAARPPANIEARHSRPGGPSDRFPDARDRDARGPMNRGPEDRGQQGRGPIDRGPEARDAQGRGPIDRGPVANDRNRPDPRDNQAGRRSFPHPPASGIDTPDNRPVARGRGEGNDSFGRNVPRPGQRTADAGMPSDRGPNPGARDRGLNVPKPGHDMPHPTPIESRRTVPPTDVGPRGNFPRPTGEVRSAPQDRSGDSGLRNIDRGPQANFPRATGEVRSAPPDRSANSFPRGVDRGPQTNFPRPTGEVRSAPPERGPMSSPRVMDRAPASSPSRASGGWGGGSRPSPSPSPRMSAPRAEPSHSAPSSGGSSRASSGSHGGGERTSHGGKPQ